MNCTFCLQFVKLSSTHKTGKTFNLYTLGQSCSIIAGSLFTLIESLYTFSAAHLGAISH